MKQGQHARAEGNTEHEPEQREPLELAQRRRSPGAPEAVSSEEQRTSGERSMMVLRHAELLCEPRAIAPRAAIRGNLVAPRARACPHDRATAGWLPIRQQVQTGDLRPMTAASAAWPRVGDWRGPGYFASSGLVACASTI